DGAPAHAQAARRNRRRGARQRRAVARRLRSGAMRQRSELPRARQADALAERRPMTEHCNCTPISEPCDCCEGPRALTPAATANRPGLSKLVYRVGTQATFFETMQARLSSTDYPALRALKTRERSDPAIALLDAWATVADVLTFYQERIANEG